VVTAWVFSAAIRVKIAAARHRAVDLELTVRLSGGLLQALDAGELDLVLRYNCGVKSKARLGAPVNQGRTGALGEHKFDRKWQEA
jgi:hypothetical protein